MSKTEIELDFLNNENKELKKKIESMRPVVDAALEWYNATDKEYYGAEELLVEACEEYVNEEGDDGF